MMNEGSKRQRGEIELLEGTNNTSESVLIDGSLHLRTKERQRKKNDFFP